MPFIKSRFIHILCRFYGSVHGCRYGNNCEYLHDNPESVPLCRNILSFKSCRYSNKCQYRHPNYHQDSEINHSDIMKHNNNKLLSVTHPSMQPMSKAQVKPTIYTIDAYLIANNYCRNYRLQTDDVIFHVTSDFASYPDFQFQIPKNITYKNKVELSTCKKSVKLTKTLVCGCPYEFQSHAGAMISFRPILNKYTMIRNKVVHCCEFKITCTY